MNIESYDIEYIQETISEIFAMPEVDQAAAWDAKIVEIEGYYSSKVADDDSFKEVIRIIKSIASEAKYFA